MSETAHIPHSRPTLGQDEVAAVSEVIASGHIAQGKKVRDFEAGVSEIIGVPYAAAVSSGTSALYLTLYAMGVGEGDEVIIPSFVCTALLNAVRYTGAEPVFADIEEETYNIDPEDVKKRLTPRTKAVIVPHMFGAPADLETLTALDVPIIEDCAQAVGATYAGGPVGALGHAAVCSFFATKVITSGGGGMVVSRSKRRVERIRNIREYDNRKAYELRFNCKMTDIQAAMGLVQLSRLQTFVRKRRKIARMYQDAFDTLGLGLPVFEPGHIFYRYVVTVGSGGIGRWSDQLTGRGIACAQPVFRPLHLYLGRHGYPRTERVWRNALSIPVYPSLSNEDIKRVIDEVTLAERKLHSET